MRKFTIAMEGNVNGIETKFALKLNFTEEQLQKFIIQEALLEAEHKGFEGISVLSVEEESQEFTQMGLFPDEQSEPNVSVSDTSQANTYTTYNSVASNTEEDTEDTEENIPDEPGFFPQNVPTQNCFEEDCCDEDEEDSCCDEEGNCTESYTPYTGTSSPKATQSKSAYTAYATSLLTKAPKSYHLKIENGYAPYRSFRVNISTVDDIT